MTKVAVILSGCGFLDGAEVRESVLTLLYLDQQGAQVDIFAPNENQHHVMNHLTQEETSETRNVLVESARIARGNIADIKALSMETYDALVIPGGFGVAKNLSDLAFKGAEMTPHPELVRVVKECVVSGKPLGAMCIAPAVIAGIVGDGVEVTIGEDAGTAQAIEVMGGKHTICASEGAVADSKHNIYSCSAYMREDPIAAVAKGIETVVSQVIKSAGGSQKAA